MTDVEASGAHSSSFSAPLRLRVSAFLLSPPPDQEGRGVKAQGRKEEEARERCSQRPGTSFSTFPSSPLRLSSPIRSLPSLQYIRSDI